MRRLILLRWVFCSTLVLAAHGLAVFLLLPHADAIDEDAGSPVAFIELAPIPVAPPAPPSDLAPGPLQPENEGAESIDESAPPPVAEPQKPAIAEPLASEGRETPNVQAAKTPPMPTAKTPPKEAAQEPPSEVSIPSAPPSVAGRAQQSAGPAMGRLAQMNSVRVARWERILVAHIERFKRYPLQAQGRYGVARVAFRLDREGRLLSARIAGGSGSGVLDDEALATVRRAAPFPRPPEGVSDGRLSFVLPIRFTRSSPR